MGLFYSAYFFFTKKDDSIFKALKKSSGKGVVKTLRFGTGRGQQLFIYV